MKNKDLEKYSTALSALTLQMKTLRVTAVRTPEEQVQICRAMRDIARAMVEISKPLAFIKADEEIGKDERGEYEDSLEKLEREIDEQERRERR
ncbi:hypothetical protein [Phascolarctobacterium sp.]